MATAVPTKMRALFLVKKVASFTQEDINSCFVVREVDVPQLKEGEALVKVECSPINPSNLSIITGSYNSAAQSPLPTTLGTEGSGTVVATNGPAVKVGQRVGIFLQKGIWAEYVVVNGAECVPLPDDVSFEGGCSIFVNPLTVVSFVEIALERGVKTIVHTAGASALGKMLVQHAKDRGVQVIAVVRRPEQVQALQAVGAEHIIDTSDAEWKGKFKELAKSLEATLAFDAVAGSLVGVLLANMPNGSEVQVYGGLSGQAVSGVSPLGFIFEDKKVSGFWLVKYLGKKDPAGKFAMIKQVVAGLNTSFKTTINKSYPLEQAVAAFHDYIANMSDNKIAFKPSQQA
ncbi:hypothetical protein LEN26_007042 [Aphanomyces euteiches]|nr:hypothetical protein LEN26_007042 [Aphanomyces euteiches]